MLMFLSLSFLIVTANVFHSEGQQVVHARQRIVGGEKAAIDTVPYQVQLLRDAQPICGGVIISERWIVSAAHCIVAPASVLSIITGSDKLTSGQYRAVKRTVVHPAYDQNSNDNDISLIELENNIEFNVNQEAIEIATTVPLAGEIITVSGFGKEVDGEDAPLSETLKVTAIPVVDYDECKQKYTEDPITTSVFCAGLGPTDACQGDSGGPAVIDGTLVGIVSSGMKCGDSYYPGLYTRVANYRQWISDTINCQLSKYPTKDQSSKYPTSHVLPPFESSQPVTLLGKIAAKLINVLI